MKVSSPLPDVVVWSAAYRFRPALNGLGRNCHCDLFVGRREHCCFRFCMRDDAAAAESRRLVCAVTVGYRGGGRHLARAVRTGPGQFFPLRTLHCGATCFETQPTLEP